eukprot:scaffold338_cov116-Cylindrotheca_fusiformis.AAC.10
MRTIWNILVEAKFVIIAAGLAESTPMIKPPDRPSRAFEFFSNPTKALSVKFARNQRRASGNANSLVAKQFTGNNRAHYGFVL